MALWQVMGDSQGHKHGLACIWQVRTSIGQPMAWVYEVGLTLDINSYSLMLQVGTARVQANPLHESMPCLNLLNVDVYHMDVFFMSYVKTSSICGQ